MATWIFQANPDTFDIDAYLSEFPAELLWLVRRYGEDIAPGDQVFIWRASGRAKTKSGIVAEATVVEPPTVQPDLPASRRYWANPAAGDEPTLRVRLVLVRSARRPKQVVRRDWFPGDPALMNLSILKMANGTNFKVRPEEAARLNALWLRTGIDWTYAESLAGLWAYAKTYGGEVSRQPGSPVSRVALAIGRAVTDTYSKVMNFRSLDPRHQGGLDGSSDTDERVWADFYSPGDGLDVQALDRAVLTFWPSLGNEQIVYEFDQHEAYENRLRIEAEERAALSLNQLLGRYAAKTPRPDVPESRWRPTREFARDPDVIAICRRRAGNRCEIPECTYEPFMDARNQPYVEVHHIRPLAESGPDRPENVACLCPTHHRMLHHGKDALKLRRVLEALRRT